MESMCIWELQEYAKDNGYDTGSSFKMSVLRKRI